MRISATGPLLGLLLLGLIPNASAKDLATGEAIFNSNCAMCHGTDGSGGRGPNLRGMLRHGNSNADISKVVRLGVPGTGMPKFNLEEDEMQSLVLYIQSFRKAAPSGPHPAGDAAAGQGVYQAQGCANCHQIGAQGGVMGPALTRVGAGRSYDYLKKAIVDPSSDVAPEFETVRLVTKEGKKIQGVWVNEDSFTIQIRLPGEGYASFDKQSLQELVHDKKSLMPAYNLNPTDLNNLLAYLTTLTGESESTQAREAKKLR